MKAPSPSVRTYGARARCWGWIVTFALSRDAERALRILRAHTLGEGECIVGRVAEHSAPRVTLKSTIGVRHIVDMLSGENCRASAEVSRRGRAAPKAPPRPRKHRGCRPPQ